MFEKIIDKFINKDVKKGKRVTSKIVERQNYRVKESISSWLNALKLAESVELRDKRPLICLYDEVLLDAHLKGVTELRKDFVTGNTFNVKKKSGKIDDKLTSMFRSAWFYDFLNLAMDSIFYGHSLIQIDGLINNTVSSVTLVNRENVIPETGEFIKDSYNYLDRESYIRPSQYKWLVEVFKSRTCLGDLKGIVPLVLWKRSAEQAWSEYSEIFGQPIRIAKTSSNVEMDRKRLSNFVQELGNSAWAVIDEEESIEFIETSRTDAHEIYKELIDFMNKEISKVILGSTMIVDDGASYSQSKVHAQIGNLKTKSDLRMIEFLVNDFLIPKLQNLKVISQKGIIFSFDNSEILTLEEQSIIDERINKMYPLNKEYLEDKYRVEFEKVESEPIETKEENDNSEAK